MSDWDSALDSYAVHLAAREASLHDPAAAPVAFVPPTALGPLPDRLRPRAEALLRQSREIENQLLAALHLAWQRGSLVGRFRATTPPQRKTPSFIDTRG